MICCPRSQKFATLVALALVAVLATGCRPTGPQFGNVSGKVTLDGKPLAEATVEFQPETGSPSYGITDSRGRYSLDWGPNQTGAIVGKHSVRITSFNEAKPRIRERLPAKFNSDSELTYEVRRGRQTKDWELTMQ